MSAEANGVAPALPDRLDGKVALVTGASRGIGFAIADRLARAGAAVMLSSRKPDALAAAVAQIGGDIASVAANAGEPDQAAAAVAATVTRFGSVDILVNNAATNPYFGPMIDIDLDRFDKTCRVNLRGPFVWIQEAWRQSMHAKGGTIVNVASIGGLAVETSIGVYNTTKAALIYMTRALGAELAPSVRVNAIAPGIVKTDMARALWEPAEAALTHQVPLGRLGTPTDIAEAALFLAGPASAWMTGQTIVVDGGILVRPPVDIRSAEPAVPA